MLLGRLEGSGVWGSMDTCVCMAAWLCCTPEAITALLNGYPPISNIKIKSLPHKKIISSHCYHPFSPFIFCSPTLLSQLISQKKEPGSNTLKMLNISSSSVLRELFSYLPSQRTDNKYDPRKIQNQVPDASFPSHWSQGPHEKQTAVTISK